MSGTSGVRGGHVLVLTGDEEPALTGLSCAAATEAGRGPCPAAGGDSALRIARPSAPHTVVLDGVTPVRLTAKAFALPGPLLGHPRRLLGKGRAPITRTPRGLGYAIRPEEDGR